MDARLANARVFKMIISSFKTEIKYNYDINFLRNYLGVDYKNVGKSDLMILGFPTSNLSFVTKFTFGREIAYNEDIPEIETEVEIETFKFVVKQVNDRSIQLIQIHVI